MIPLLLDALTIFFIVGSLALLWVNFGSPRLRRARMVRPKRTALVNINQAAMTSNDAPDAETCRAQAEECLTRAEQSTSQADKETWLRMGVEWIKLSQVQDRNQKTPENSITGFYAR